jgi:hypothetical protein
MTCASCKIEVEYACLSSSTQQASMVLDIFNLGASSLRLSDLKVRYWFTTDDLSNQAVGCRSAPLGCGALTFARVAVSPPRPNASAYLEIGFTAAAGALGAPGDTGNLELDIADITGAPMVQTDDYSYDCSMMATLVLARKITAYDQGVLVWGTEP